MRKISIFLQYGIFLTFCDMCPAKTSIKSTVLIFQQQMTRFWKEERLGYNICKNKENLFFWAGPPPIPLNLGNRHLEILKFSKSS